MILFLALMVLLLSSNRPIFREAHAATRTITLQGYYPGGWNNTSPIISVTQGDTVTIKFIIGDGALHQFWLDLDGDGITDQSDCTSTGDVCSASFTTTAPPPITITASAIGSYTFYCTVHYPYMQGTLKVLAPSPDFSIAPSPASLTIVQGSPGTSTITVASQNGFSGTITLSASVSPTGPSAPTISFNPMMVPVSGSTGTSTLTVLTTSSTPSGTYTVTVSGNNGTVIRTTSVSVTVPDFTITASPTSLSTTQDSTATTTITLLSLSGFSGTINLSATASPPGPGLSFSSSSIMLTPGGIATSTLTVSAVKTGTNSVATGSYSITVSAANGTLSHSTTVHATVTPPYTFPYGGLNLSPTILIGAGVIILVAVVVTVILVRRHNVK